MTVNEQNPVAKVSTKIAAMQDDWMLVDALLGGTKGMRAAGERYLPKRPLEEDSDYKQRRETATLYPAFGESIDTYAGRVFSDPLTVDDGLPPWIKEEVIPDVDKQGRNLEAYCDNWFREAMAAGLSHTLVEAPSGTAASEAERKSLKQRPYLVQLNPKAILGWKVDKDGKLSQVRIHFIEEVEDGEFGMKTEDLIRVYQIDVIRTFVKDSKGIYVEDTTRQVTNSIGVVPLVTAYTNRTGFMTAKPPLLELAYLNVKHWQQQSSHDALLETASVPILVLSGVDTQDAIPIGAKHAIKLPTGATMGYCEHTGKALEASEKSLAELRDEMRQAGAKLLEANAPQAKTATESREDSSRENSKLGGIVRLFEGSVDQVLKLIGMYRKAEVKEGAVKLNPNLEPDSNPHETIKTLTGLRNASCLSDQTLFEETQQRGLLSKDRTWEDEQKRIQENAPPPMPPGALPPSAEEELDKDGNPVKKPAVPKPGAKPPQE